MGVLAIEIGQRAVGADAKCTGLICIAMDAIQEMLLFADGQERRIHQAIDELHVRQLPSLRVDAVDVDPITASISFTSGTTADVNKHVLISRVNR
ncbi:hypothetical protein D3C72_1329110 [compost metagenome]